MNTTEQTGQFGPSLRRWRWACLLVVVVASGCSTTDSGKQSPLPWDRPLDYERDRDKMFRPGDNYNR